MKGNVCVLVKHFLVSKIPSAACLLLNVFRWLTIRTTRIIGRCIDGSLFMNMGILIEVMV